MLVTFFLIKLPENEEAPGQEAATVPTPLAQPHPLVLAGSGERVLVVEDNAGVREYTSAALCELGYLVVADNDGKEALRLIENGDQFDMLCTDVVLPGTDGREATQKLPKLAALYTTGCTKNAILHQGKLDADVHLLSKPLTQQDLARKFRAVLAETEFA